MKHLASPYAHRHRQLLGAATAVCILATGLGPVFSGRVGLAGAFAPILALATAALVAGGYAEVMSLGPLVLGAQYLASVEALQGTDVAGVMVEAAGLVVLVELQTWLLRSRSRPDVDLSVIRTRSVRVVVGAMAAAALALFTVLAAGQEDGGPNGLGALAIAVVAVVGFVAFAWAAFRPERPDGET